MGVIGTVCLAVIAGATLVDHFMRWSSWIRSRRSRCLLMQASERFEKSLHKQAAANEKRTAEVESN